jgi:predicted nucleic acid-binding protein
MSTALLDVSVLVALFNAAHLSHAEAHDRLAAHGRRKWATCPLTVHGCIRVLSGPGYPRIAATPAEVASRLRTFCDKPNHEFWPDDLSLLDETRFRTVKIAGPQRITDAYLLGFSGGAEWTVSDLRPVDTSGGGGEFRASPGPGWPLTTYSKP